MSTDQVSFDDAVWGAATPAPRRWGARETAVAVGIAAVIGGPGRRRDLRGDRAV
ncbi:hypothetical protein H7H73_04505, partial [Mycobacterium rufum]|nr:hypothetical protein [Mycolicibacterium rufum]